jgi:hypothetical protein
LPQIPPRLFHHLRFLLCRKTEGFKTVIYKTKTTTDAPVVNTVKQYWQPLIGVQNYCCCHCCCYYLYYFLLILYYSLNPSLFQPYSLPPLSIWNFPHLCLGNTFSGLSIMIY